MVTDRMYQMGLAQSHAPVDEERVVCSAGLLSDLRRRGSRELVCFPRYERNESKCGIQARDVARGRHSLSRRDPG